MFGVTPTEYPHIYRTRALGCTAEVLVTDAGSLVGAIEILHRELERIDRAASRFRADSEIAGVQRAEGRPVRISTCLADAVSAALRVAALTDGAVDPTVGQAMNRLGYDRDFAAIAAGLTGALPEPAPVPGWRSIELDRSAGTLRVPPGVVVDLGATAKALTADRIAARAWRLLGCGILVSLGGDICVAGPPPRGGFPIGLDDGHAASSPPDTVAIASGGLATSGITSRRWRLGRHDVHHIVDPSTGLMPAPMWRTASVAAGSCVDANAASTAAMVKGQSAAEWLLARQLPARLVALDGGVVRLGGWPAAEASLAPAVGQR